MVRTTSVTTPRGRFATLEAGPEDGPVAMVLHGFPDVPTSFRPTLEALAGAGYRAVAPWMRGYAPSPTEGPYDTDSIGADVVAIGDVLSPEKRIVLVGHDWGAVVGYTAIAECPNRFHCYVALSIPHPIAFMRNLAKHPTQVVRSSYMAVLATPVIGEQTVRAGNYKLVDLAWESAGASAELIDEVKQTLARSMPAPIRYYRAVFWPPFSAGLRVKEAGAKKISVPTRFVGGSRDVVKPQLGDGQERFFDGPFEAEILDTGHFMHVERTAEVNARILDWAGRYGRA